ELTGALSAQDIPALRSILNRMVDQAGLPPERRMPVDTPDQYLYHLEIAINPHRFAANDPSRGIYLRTFYRVPCPPQYQPNHNRAESERTYGDHTLGIVSRLVDRLGPVTQPHLIRGLVNQLFDATLRAPVPQPRTIGETFRFSRFRGQIASAALAVDGADTFRALHEILTLNAQRPLAGGIALRYVKGTQATLGFTRFSKTCVIEMDGVDADVTREFFRDAWLRIEAAGIPYTLHWGKLNYILTEPRVRRMYGDVAVNDWLRCRASLMDPLSQRVFTNAFMTQCGLDKPAAPFVPVA
ncbi:MAG TPA: hypothetical protein VEY71_04280, partial [Chitinophagales bacterium]|nr:hypothetical protein [Chitinophagales bacterium]